MKLIYGIHHAALRVNNLEEAFARWSHVLGLHGETRDGEAFLRCTFEDFALRLIPSSDTSGIEYVAYELSPGLPLETVRAQLEGNGLTVNTVHVPTRGMALHLNDPDGNGVVLLEHVRPSETRVAEWRFSNRIPGFHPRKFGHVNYLTSEVKRITAWYEDNLGFRLTDRIGSEGVWLHVNADHHVLAFLEKGFNHIHHLAFELVDWGEFRVALDHLGKNKRHIVWGPGRHGMARNLYSYFRMPEEDLFIELFADLEQLREDHVPRDYPDDAHASNVWGILPPRSYFRFDAEAIRAENDQLEAYAGAVTT
jgi:catechol 2,3-dioxygenase-like lactoylglutathione lyase family enzyme